MTAPDAPAAVDRQPASVGKIVFDLFLLAVVGTFVVAALGLKPGAALVPLIVGVPTVVALLIRTVMDVLRLGRDYRPTPEEPEVHDLDAQLLAEASLSDLAKAARAEIEEESQVSPDEAKRQRVFAIWGASYVVVSALLTTYLAPVLGLHTYFVPVALVALVVILRIIKLSWLKTLAISAGLIGVMYVLLVMFLNVRL
jgi:hypothetical protein